MKFLNNLFGKKPASTPDEKKPSQPQSATSKSSSQPSPERAPATSAVSDPEQVKKMKETGNCEGLWTMLVTSQDPKVRADVVHALCYLMSIKFYRSQSLEILQKIDPSTRQQFADEFLKVVKPAADVGQPPLMSSETMRLVDLNEYYVGVIEVLGNIGGETVVNELSQLLMDCQSFLIRNAAIKALGQIGDPKAFPALIVMMNSKGLQGFSDSKAAEALMQMKAPADLFVEFLLGSDKETFNYMWYDDLLKYIQSTGCLEDPVMKTRVSTWLSGHLTPDSPDYSRAKAEKRLAMLNLTPVASRTLLNQLYLLSWYYQGQEGEGLAQDFYKNLKAGIEKGQKFPFDCAYQVGFVHSAKDEHWAVGILVAGGTDSSDLQEQTDELIRWFEACGAESAGTDKSNIPQIQNTIEETLQKKYGPHYTCIETFGIAPGLWVSGNLRGG